MQTEHYDNAADFLAAMGGTKRKAAKDARPGLPRSPAGEGDRINALMRIARFGYGPRWEAGAHFFWNPQTGVRTSPHADYAAAVIAAEKEVGR